MREKVIKAIEEEKIIVIVRGVAKEKLIPLAEAMYKGGIRILEVTFDASGKVSDIETAENIRMLVQAFEGRMYIGAGTVLKPEQVQLVSEAGGGFIISPNTDKDVIMKTRNLSLVSMPGALTPSEICIAHRYGADFVKLFPASDFGPGYVKSVKAPLSHIRLTVVGGINEDNMCEYIDAGASGVGVGANIVSKKMIDNGDYNGITALAKKYTDALN